MDKQFFTEGFVSILAKVVHTLSLFLVSILLAKNLGPNGYGIYSFSFAMLMIMSIPLQAGIPQLSLRESAKETSKNNYQAIHILWMWILKRNAIAFLFMLAAFIGFYLFFFKKFEVYIYLLLVGLPSVLFFSLMLCQSYITRGMKKNILGLISENIIFPISLLFFLLFISYFDSTLKLDPFFAMSFYSVAVFLGYVSSLVIFKNLYKKSPKSRASINPDVTYWKHSLYTLSFVGGLQLLYGNLDLIWIGVFGNDSDVGVYKAILQISSLVIFGLVAINQILYSRFAALYASNKLDDLQRLVAVSSLTITFLAFIPFIFIVLETELIIDIIFGEEYLRGANALIILIFGQFLNASFGSVGALLNMTGHEKDAIKGMVIALVLNIILSFILIPVYGIIGASISASLSLLTWNLILRFYVKKNLQIESIGLFSMAALFNKKSRIL
jgi:O-antigen/teichoic acid export membrane protein